MHLYSACIAVHPKQFTIMGGGGSPQPPAVCSIHLDDVTSATGQRRQCAHHTPATSGESVIEPIKWILSPHTSYRWRAERVIESIKWMGIIRRPWLTRASRGSSARTPGLHPYSLQEVSCITFITFPFCCYGVILLYIMLFTKYGIILLKNMMKGHESNQYTD